MVIYVADGTKNLTQIASEYGVPPSVVASDNGLSVSSPLARGQALVIRFPRELYTVKSGDTLFSVAARYGTNLNALYRNNPFLKGRPELREGDLLAVSFETNQSFSFPLGGYAYPYISDDLLGTVLPFMNLFIPFTYGISLEGTLLPLDDERLLSFARMYGVPAYMHLSTLTAGDVFDVSVAETVLSSAEKQDELITQVLQNMRQKGYAGLDIDFEFLGKQNSGRYAEFISRARNRLNAEGFPVIVALAPKTSDDQKGELYEGHDYALIGEAADFVLLMTYEWGYTYGPPLAISPVPSVRRVIEYALTRIQPQKIYLGISNYGYDWTLPYEKGVSPPAPSLSTEEAFTLALQTGSQIEYDTEAEAPFFVYQKDGVQHEVWFEDARSIEAKLSLVPEYGLYGALYWNLMRSNVSNLSLIASLIKGK